MTAVQRLVANGNSIINFLKEFSSATAKDVSVDWVNDDGTIETKTFANIKKFQTIQRFDIIGENLNIGGSTDSRDFVNIINKNYSGKPNGKYIINFHMAIRSDRGSEWNLLVPQIVCNGAELDGDSYIGNTTKFIGFFSTSVYGNFDSNGNLEFKVNIRSYQGQTIWWGKSNQADPAKGVNINLIREI